MLRTTAATTQECLQQQLQLLLLLQLLLQAMFQPCLLLLLQPEVRQFLAVLLQLHPSPRSV
jgi:hypothetical protein